MKDLGLGEVVTEESEDGGELYKLPVEIKASPQALLRERTSTQL